MGAARPTFFGVGNPKAGATTLFKLLGAHPQLCLTPEREPNFFATDLTSTGYPWAPPLSLEEYLALFEAAEPGQVCGEVSPSYLHSDVALEQLAAFEPDARVIVVFREPVAAMRSAHGSLLRAGLEDELDFAAALALESERRAGRRLPPRSRGVPRITFYRCRVGYRQQIERLDATFRSEQLLLLTFEQLAHDQQHTADRICEHIGVRPAPLPPVHANRGIGPRASRATYRLDHPRTTLERGAATLVSGARRALPASAEPRLIRHGLHPLHTRPARVDPELRAALRHELREEVEAVARRLGDDELLDRWGYR